MAWFETLMGSGELTLAYIQYISLLLNSVKIEWPEIWSKWLNWTKLLLLDINNKLPKIPVLDFRAHYLMVVVFCPLIFSVILLVFTKDWTVSLWYFVLLISLSLLGSGLAIRFLPPVSILNFASRYGKDILLIGSGGTFLCIAIFICYQIYYRSTKRKIHPELIENSDHDTEGFKKAVAKYKEVGTKKRGIASNILKWLSIIVLVVVGLAFHNIFGSLINFIDKYRSPFSSMSPMIGNGCFVLAGIIFIYWILNLIPQTRKKIEAAKLFLLNKFIRISLFLMMTFYTPIATTIFSPWNCVSITCSAGTTFPEKSRVAFSQTFIGNKSICIPCDFINTNNPDFNSSSCPFVDVLCPTSSSSRLMVDVGISCENILYYYAPISAVMTLGFILGIPVLFTALIRQHDNLLKRIPAIDDMEEKNWTYRVLTTNNSAKSLYAQFEKKMKYFKVYIIIEKLLLVTLAVFIFGVLQAMALTTTCIHLTTVVVGLITRPFLSPALDFLFNATNIAMFISSVIGTLIVFSIRVPNVVSIIVVFLVFALPIIGTAIGAIISYRQEKKVEEKINANGTKSELENSTHQNLNISLNSLNKKNEIEEKIVLTPRTLTSIDRAVDAKTTKLISNYAFFLGFISFLALFGAVIGIIHASSVSKTSSPVLSNSFGLEDEKIMLVKELVGYRDWNEFTQNCCCLNATSSITDSFLSVERWKCKNGYTKERLREEKKNGQYYSGLRLRPFCGAKFTNQVCSEPYYQQDKFKVDLCVRIK